MSELKPLLAAVRDLLLALKDVDDLPPPLWAALDEVRKAVAPDLGPPPSITVHVRHPDPARDGRAFVRALNAYSKRQH